MEIAPFGLLAIFAIAAVAIFIFNFYRKQQRREDSGLWAMRHNLQFSPADPFGLTNRGFRLFSKGDGRGCENVMWGTFKYLPVTAADYWYYERRTDERVTPPATTRTSRWLSTASTRTSRTSGFRPRT